MPTEIGNIDSDEKGKKKRKKLEEEKQKGTRILFEQKKKEALQKKEKLNTELSVLKEELESGEKSGKEIMKKAEHLKRTESLETEEVQDILRKIDEIQHQISIERYLPRNLLITQDEYIKALKDPTVRGQVIQKLDSALTILASEGYPQGKLGLNLFLGYVALLDKNLVLIQANYIDIKRSLTKDERLPTLFELIKNLFK